MRHITGENSKRKEKIRTNIQIHAEKERREKITGGEKEVSV
jgi:hypothetical protein